MEPLVSVIVPVYNVEKYLPQCIESIINQTYRNLEIILVNDGSTDASGHICDAYSGLDDRIRVIHKENGGLSSARNAGLDCMTGELLAFVDSDDLLTENAIADLYALMSSENADLVVGSSRRIDENDVVIGAVDNNYSRQAVYDPVEAMQDMFEHGCSAWGRLYKKKIHEGILFPLNEINEDEAIVLQILERCSKVVVTPDVVYLYRCRSDSITTNSFSKKKLVWPEHCKANLRFVQEKYPQLEYAAAARYRGSLMWALTEIAMLDDLSAYEMEKIKLLNDLHINKLLFWKAGFMSKREMVRFILLSCFPFKLYRFFLRQKRSNS